MDNPILFYVPCPSSTKTYWKEKPYVSIKQQRLNDMLCGQTLIQSEIRKEISLDCIFHWKWYVIYVEGFKVFKEQHNIKEKIVFS